ncbi:hypothetical protein BAE44_0021779, partial [Dichanthelium oligosanthes]
LEAPERFWVWSVTYSHGFCRLYLPGAKDYKDSVSLNCAAHAARDETMSGR